MPFREIAALTASEIAVVGETIFTVGTVLSIVMFIMSLLKRPAESSAVTEIASCPSL